MLNAQNLGVHFAGNYLFKQASFRVNPKDRIGLAGKNGAGKSTLLRILAKHQEAPEGEVNKEGDISIGFLTQDIDFVKGRTVWQEAKTAFEQLIHIQEKLDYINQQLTERTDYESDSYSKLIEDLNVYTERFNLLGGYTIDADIEKILLGLGFKKSDFTRKTDEFSGGWRMRIELAKLLLQQHDVLLLDEPTNHLDIDSIIWLEEFLKDYPGSVILVSHDKQFLNNLTNRTLEIANQQIHDYKASYNKYIELRKERKEKLEQAKKNQEQYIKHTEQLINKFRAKASKASTAQSLMKKLDRLEVVEVENEDVHKLNIQFQVSVNPGKVIFELQNVSKSYGNNTIFSDVSFFVNRGEKIAFVGQNGQGKTTLAKALVNELDYNGNITPGHNVQIGYFAQNQADVLNENHTVLQEAEHAANEDTRKKVRDYLGAFLFGGEDADKKVKVLSGGERNRLALCKLLLQPSNVLIMDEPTNHLDIQSKEMLKNALKNYDGTLILISHDREFLQDLAEKVFEFKEGKVNEFLGGINDYLADRKADSFRQIEKVELAPEQKNNANTNVQKPSYQQTKEQKKLKNKISKTETEIQTLESSIKQTEKLFLQEPPTQNQIEQYNQTKQQLEEKMQLWEELSIQITD